MSRFLKPCIERVDALGLTPHQRNEVVWMLERYDQLLEVAVTKRTTKDPSEKLRNAVDLMFNNLADELLDIVTKR